MIIQHFLPGFCLNQNPWQWRSLRASQLDRIIAIRPPISRELEQALWQQWRISLVVTKASGQSGRRRS